MMIAQRHDTISGVRSRSREESDEPVRRGAQLRHFLALVGCIILGGAGVIAGNQGIRFVHDSLVGEFVERFRSAERDGALNLFRFGKSEAQFGIAMQIRENFLQQESDRFGHWPRGIGSHPSVQSRGGDSECFGDLLPRQAVRFDFFDDQLTCHKANSYHFCRKNRVLF